jgi:hypothetical protein
MADNQEEELEIVLEDAPEAKEPEIEVVKADEGEKKPESKVIAPEEGLEALKAKLASEQQAREREKAAREAAERQRDEASEREYRARNEAQDSNLHLITNAIALVKQSADNIKARYRDAAANADFDAMAELQMEMATKASELQQLEQAKNHLEKAPKIEEPQRGVSDPVEAVAQHMAKTGSPRSAEWIRERPQFITDPRLNQKLMAAHNLAFADGYKPDSDEYFEKVESILGLGQERSESRQDENAAPQRRASPPSAPVSRSGNGPAANPNIVRLSSAEREMAASMQMTEKEYAKYKLELQREGKLGNVH